MLRSAIAWSDGTLSEIRSRHCSDLSINLAIAWSDGTLPYCSDLSINLAAESSGDTGTNPFSTTGHSWEP
ncbi:unnamed protein product [Linum tenue]|uniref:Uncharacterized protein n=1 Tax=Linum tenue TaxID=586396 RepID=A0AAV0KUE4_9ROSI|nr:unnamed protein product [Linum tenue]